MFSADASTLLWVGGIALAALLLLRNASGRFALGRRKEPDPREIRKLLGERGRDRALADAPPEILRWQVEMHETARDLKAELDSKLAALQALTLLARQERERLEAALALARRDERPLGSSPSLGAAGHASDASPIPPAAPATQHADGHTTRAPSACG